MKEGMKEGRKQGRGKGDLLYTTEANIKTKAGTERGDQQAGEYFFRGSTAGLPFIFEDW